MPLTFGHYASEPIEWLEVESDGNAVTLISAKGLDAKPYNKGCAETTWENCTLREWLNGEFLNCAFTDEERAGLMKMQVVAEKNPVYSTETGGDTEDNVRLAGIDEVRRWFPTDRARACRPSDRAKQGNAYTNEDGTGWWWLRTVGCDPYEASNVCSDGSVNSDGYNVCIGTGIVRPVIVLRLS